MQPSSDQRDQFESAYQKTCIDVTGKEWDLFGNVLIGISTLIMTLQFAGIGPQWVWKITDDCTTVLFTFELLIRVFEKGYLFFVEEGKYWNFFDTLVVTISLGSMIMMAKSGKNDKHHHGGGGGGGGAANKIKLLRTLRLLRLLRLLRVFKGVEKVNHGVEAFLKSLTWSFIALIVIAAMVAMLATVAIAIWAAAHAW
eukprot:CAMPEP_0169275738 /NCGR_PEP_ID=MMETSP1016-20121227/52569_1 /TAXON_ID=342587 /ORGANISM="Karlodinium micrum, Strain CCMP2283" /LENGTH=197 /DNA_ID=CAMNT_0009362687 /DNA_START=37 /DNA_END=627 /DNA_ORIENTATION=-